MQHLEDANTEDGSGGATDADDQACGLRVFHAESFSMKYEGGRKGGSTRCGLFSVQQRNTKLKREGGNWAVTAGPPFSATVGANTWPPVAEPFGPSSEWRCPWKIVDYFFIMLR